MKISIIIPIYNAEKYLVRCLDSVLALKSVDWECILIDDGSTDQSWDIICEYAKCSNRFIIRRKANGGVSSARNLGLKICTGDRVMFVDPDDYFFPEADSLIYKAVTRYDDRDMVIFLWADVFKNGTKEIAEIPMGNFNKVDDWIRKLVAVSFTMCTCWAKLFKSSVIEENQIRFDESMRVAEDGYFVCEYLKYCNKVSVCGGREKNEQLYAYCIHQDSAVRKFDRKDMLDELRTYHKKLELAENRGVFLSQQEKAGMNGYFLSSIFRHANNCADHCSIKEFKDIMTQLFENKEISEIVGNCYIAPGFRKRKVKKFMLRNKFFGLYWYALTLNKHIRKLKEL